MRNLYFFIIFMLFKKLQAQNIAEEIAQERSCPIYTTCDSCVQAETNCVWCYQENFSGDRCGPKSALIKYGCQEKYIFLNGEDSAVFRNDSDKDFHDVQDPDKVEESVQIKPQRISVKLKPKQPLNFQFTYRLAENYPLDLYYLMDLTHTMEYDVKTMATLGLELTEVLKNLTKHYRVAFGYYSDKVVMPFSKMTKEFLDNPCTDSGKKCEMGFDFVHSLNFTDKIDEFIEKIGKSKTTSNLDNLEGGMDALYQIILCEDYIQWRKNSRRIIVVATDGTLHFAGDGILSGAVKRNSNKCFLDGKGIYDKSLIYDYPSLEEVYHRLLENKMNVLFAAKEDALQYYKDLNSVIPSVSFVGKLEEKSTNVLKLVKEGYFNVVKNVEFSANNTDNLKVTFKTTCNKMRMWNVSSMCDNVEVGKEYIFDVTIDLLHIPMDRDREIIKIEEKNIAEELIVEIEYVGKCKCDNLEIHGKRCSNHGTYKCGICECEGEWKGENCDMQCTDQGFEECREKNESYTSSTCYGHGDCDCGKCLCDRDYTGKFCQERQCPTDPNGKVCGGYLHGMCHDGECRCRKAYTGVDCSCPISTKNCIPPGRNDVCSSNGQCKCGKCICNGGASGDYCEVCPTCSESSGICNTFEGCVMDTLKNITNSEKCFQKDGTVFLPQIIDSSFVTDTSTCYIRYEKEEGYICSTQYRYNIRKDFIVDLEIYNECHKPMRASVFIAIIIGAILAVGFLLILAWKAKLMNDDRREYARFQEDLHRNKMLSENPLYNSPIRTYQMPTQLQLSS